MKGGDTRKVKTGIALALVLAAAPATHAVAQTQAALTLAEMPAASQLTIRRLVPEVQVVFSSQDRRGRPVLNLNPQQIRVTDNGIAAHITSFQNGSALPLRLALVVDESDSMQPDFAAENQAARELLCRTQRSSYERIFALAFAAGEAAAVQTADSELPVLSTTPPGGQTALYDALVNAARLLHSSTPARRVLLLFSDGDDNYSRSTLAEAIASLQQANISVYSFTVHSPRLQYPGDRVLRQIAAATGGRAFLLRDYRQTAGIFARVESELRSQYVVGFRPPGNLAVGEFHRVKVGAPGRIIRARSGYYVPATSSY